jgi:hypothetical protein
LIIDNRPGPDIETEPLVDEQPPCFVPPRKYGPTPVDAEARPGSQVTRALPGEVETGSPSGSAANKKSERSSDSEKARLLQRMAIGRSEIRTAPQRMTGFPDIGRGDA